MSQEIERSALEKQIRESEARVIQAWVDYRAALVKAETAYELARARAWADASQFRERMQALGMRFE